jgi:hypothetical protein
VNPVRREDASNRRVRTIDNMEPQMNRYDPRTPRTLFAFAAVAMTGITLAISVLAPAGIERPATQGDLLTRVESEICAPSGGTLVTAIDVVAIRAPQVAPVAQSRGNEQRLGRS